ncbi:hypothetical protein K2X33_09775 [bacterium]|nr:hypothetical protein [bacterium]
MQGLVKSAYLCLALGVSAWGATLDREAACRQAILQPTLSNIPVPMVGEAGLFPDLEGGRVPVAFGDKLWATAITHSDGNSSIAVFEEHRLLSTTAAVRMDTLAIAPSGALDHEMGIYTPLYPRVHVVVGGADKDVWAYQFLPKREGDKTPTFWHRTGHQELPDKVGQVFMRPARFETTPQYGHVEAQLVLATQPKGLVGMKTWRDTQLQLLPGKSHIDFDQPVLQAAIQPIIKNAEPWKKKAVPSLEKLEDHLLVAVATDTQLHFVRMDRENLEVIHSQPLFLKTSALRFLGYRTHVGFQENWLLLAHENTVQVARFHIGERNLTFGNSMKVDKKVVEIIPQSPGTFSVVTENGDVYAMGLDDKQKLYFTNFKPTKKKP